MKVNAVQNLRRKACLEMVPVFSGSMRSTRMRTSRSGMPRSKCEKAAKSSCTEIVWLLSLSIRLKHAATVRLFFFMYSPTLWYMRRSHSAV